MPGTPRRNEQHSDDDFVATAPARQDAVAGLRRDFSDWLSSEAVDAETRAELGVVFSELGANAVHGSPGASSPIGVHAWSEGCEVVLEVRNVAAGTPSAPVRWDLDDPLRGGGRGLLIVQAFVDALDVQQDDDTHVVVQCRRCVTRS